jgi:hypothetical protein
MTAVVGAVVVLVGLSTDAACPTYTTNYKSTKDNGVPCDDITRCFSTGVAFKCADGSAIEAYMNTAPPNAWYNCIPKSGAGACSEAPQTCGTTVWFKDWPGCNNSCTVNPAQDVAFCKSPPPQ